MLPPKSAIPLTRIISSLIVFLTAAALPAAPAYSQLWGEAGEKWSAAGRLPHFSRAGYHQGERPIPELPRATNVRDLGAVGDGTTDDTKALQAAIDATPAGAVYLPPGRYLVSDFIRITRSGVVLRGAGPEQSILWFPRGLDAIHPRARKTATGGPASGYSFDGAFVTLEGNTQSKKLAAVTTVAQRGDREIEVDRIAGLTVGQLVLLVVGETPDQSLKTYLYNGDPGDIAKGKQRDTQQLFRITAIAGELMGATRVRLYHDHVLVKEPGTRQRTPWHQDIPYYDVDGRQNISMWCPVDPVSRASTLELVAGTHLGPWYMPRSFLDGQAKWFPDGSLAELPDIAADPDRFRIIGWELEPGDAVFFHMLTLHGSAGVEGPNRRRVLSVRFLGDDMVHAPRQWVTSPPFPGLEDELPAGAPLDHPLFPVLWEAAA
jgi:hypothetical protein